MAEIHWLGWDRVSLRLTSDELASLGEDRSAGLQSLLTPPPPKAKVEPKKVKKSPVKKTAKKSSSKGD